MRLPDSKRREILQPDWANKLKQINPVAYVLICVLEGKPAFGEATNVVIPPLEVVLWKHGKYVPVWPDGTDVNHRNVAAIWLATHIVAWPGDERVEYLAELNKVNPAATTAVIYNMYA